MSMWMRIENKVVTKIYSGSKKPEGTIDIPPDSPVDVGDDTRFYDSNWHRISPEEAEKKGLLPPIEGTEIRWDYGKYRCYRVYYNKDTARQEKFEVGAQPDNYTEQQPPIQDAVWDGGKWVIPKEVREQVARDKRNYLLTETDYLVLPDYPITDTKRQEWEDYRQLLRDVTKQTGFPDSVDWPTKPE